MILTGVWHDFTKLLCLLVLLAGIGVSARAQNVYTDENGVRIAIQVKPQKSRILLGEPIFINAEFNVISFGTLSGEGVLLQLSESTGAQGVSVTAIGADGTSVDQSNAETFLQLMDSESRSRISGSTIDYWKLCLPRWAAFRKPGTYRIRVQNHFDVISLKSGKRASGFAVGETTITVLPSDQAKLGEIIRDLGKKVLTGRDSSELETLLLFEDPRVIPFLVQKLAQLGRLEAGRQSTNPEPRPKQPQVHSQGTLPNNANDIFIMSSGYEREITRLVNRLARFNPEDAMKGLAKAAKSPSWLVRARIAEELASDSSTQTRAILEKLAHDPVDSVREAARASLSRRKSRTALLR